MSNKMKHLSIGFFITLFIALSSLAFYWYEYRPSKIRQECSWVSKHQDAVSERSAKTEEQLRADGTIIDCIEPNRFCDALNESSIEEYSRAIPAQPARDWYDKASEKEYEFCIRSKGLTK